MGPPTTEGCLSTWPDDSGTGHLSSRTLLGNLFTGLELLLPFRIVDLHLIEKRNETSMARLWVKFQRFFRRRPIRVFMLIALYLTAGSLVFLHASFTGEPRVSENRPSSANEGTSGKTELQYLGTLQLSRGFKELPEPLTTARRYGSWFKIPSKDTPRRSSPGDYGGTWSRALKGRNVREKEEEKGKGPSQGNPGIW